jgi:hypothetical protein
MTPRNLPRGAIGGAGLLTLALVGLAVAGAGLSIAGRLPAAAWHAVFVLLAGLVVGSLGLLMIGHLMSEEWLAPVRSEAEAAALTAPLVVVLAVPLVPALGDIFPWAAGAASELPRPRAAFLTTPFFLARSAFYLAVWSALALWIARSESPRRASAVGLALLAPTAAFAGNDWVLSRDPVWWSSLFGFAFSVAQLLAALAGGILVSLLRPEHPTPERMKSLERALLTLALLTLWIWLVQFIVVWLGNLPDEAAWYLTRWADRSWLLAGIALPALLAAVAILAPPGFGRRTMIIGSGLLLVQHVAHLLWLVDTDVDLPSVVVVSGVFVAWGALFAALLQRRPTFEAELGKPPRAATRLGQDRFE